MAIEIGKTLGGRAAGGILNLPDAETARATLKQLKDDIQGRSGVLKLMHTTDPKRAMTFEYKSWWQFWARRDSKMTATGAYVRRLFEKAYGEIGKSTDEAAFKALMSDLQNTLLSKNSLIGKNTITTYVQHFERLIAPFEVVSGNSVNEVLSTFIDLNGTYPLGEGSFGVVKGAKTRDGEMVAVKEFKKEMNTSMLKIGNLRKGEAVGIRLGDNHSARPIAMVIERNGKYECIQIRSSGNYKAAKNYLKKLQNDPTEDVVVAAMVMPLLSGNDLAQIRRRERIKPEQRRSIALQGLQSLSKLHKRGILHRDIKPDNMIYDRLTGRLSMIDYGLGAKISKQGETLNKTAGSLPYIHPSVLAKKDYGLEIDLFSFSISLLAIKSPALFAGIDAVRLVSNGKGYSESPDFKRWQVAHPGQSYLKSLLSYTENYFALKVDAETKDGLVINPGRITQVEGYDRLRGFAEMALEELDSGESLELEFIEKSLEVAMREPNMSQETREGRFRDYYKGLEELQRHPYINSGRKRG